MGDRRDFFVAETDLWEMVTRIAEGRKAREIDPTLEMLRTCAVEAEADRRLSRAAVERIGAMRDFVEMVDRWALDIKRVPRAQLTALMKLGSAIVRFLPGKRAKDQRPGRE
jgi:DNA-binding transcriptional regulator GbsR (MarR family)